MSAHCNFHKFNYKTIEKLESIVILEIKSIFMGKKKKKIFVGSFWEKSN